MIRDDAEIVEPQPEGYAIDRHFPDLIYIPEDAQASIAAAPGLVEPGRPRGGRSRWRRARST